MWIIKGFLITGVLLSSAHAQEVRGSVDVKEGGDAVLRCRFDPSTVEAGAVSFYWNHISSEQELDTIAIQENAFRKLYHVDSRPEEGRYDLHISGATYERDNGQFQCMARRGGGEADLHAETVQLTVLLPPNPPSIEPQLGRLAEGRPTTLRCSSRGGSPPPELRWYRRGTAAPLAAELTLARDRSQPTVSELTLTPSREDDGEELECVVWNRAMAAGERMTAAVPLSVDYYPRVTVGPSNPLRVEAGRSIQMRCDVDAKPSVANVRWVRNNAFINTAFTHRIDAVERADAGVYSCSAENSVSEQKADLTLDVLYGPRVSVEVQRELEVGGSAQVMCDVEANPAAESVYWRKEGDAEFRQQGATLRLSRVRASDGGKYMCVAVNRILSHGMTESEQRVGNATINIHVRHAPGPASIVPESPVGVEGRPLTLTCVADPPGYPEPKYRWWRRESPEAALGFGQNFTVGSVLPRHAGEYLCQPENGLGRGDTASTAVRVFQAPYLGTRLQPEVKRPVATTGFAAACSAHGRPRPSVAWMKDGEDIQTAAGRYEVTIDESERKDGSFEVRSTLSFRGRARTQDRLTPMDRGNYTCRFENAAGTEETTMLLRIRHAPIVYHSYNKVAFDVGEEAIIRCQMQAYPAPTFRWTRRGAAVVTDTPSAADSFYSTNTSRLGNDVHQSTLRLASVREEDYGGYVCQAQNGDGERSTELRLQRKSRPEPPTQLKAAELGTDWVLLDWTAGFDGGFKDVFHHVTLLDERDKERAFDCQTRRPCNVTSLLHRTTYRVRVRANNKKGASELSEQAQFTTRLDVSQLPQPQRVQFSRRARQLSFHVISSPIDVVGTLDVRSADGGWRHSDQQVLVNNNRGLADLADQLGELGDVRVRLCLREDVSVCSKAVVAEHVSASVVSVAAGGINMTTIIIVVVSAIAAVTLLVLLFICCCRRGSGKAKTKKGYTDASYDRQKMPGYFPAGTGVPSKPISDANGLSQLDASRALYGGRPANPEYGTSPPRGAGGANPAPVNTAYTEQSYSNSNTGGSVNSQDSLWQVKSGGGDNRPYPQQHDPAAYDPAPTGYDHAGYDPTTAGYDPASAGYGGPEMAGYGDYAPYPPQQQEPYPVAYPTEGAEYGRQYDTDPYGPPGTRARPHPADGGYRVSGMPDPYAAQAAQEPEPSKPQMSFDESLESGYSTPNTRNRRVIREIIV